MTTKYNISVLSVIIPKTDWWYTSFQQRHEKISHACYTSYVVWVNNIFISQRTNQMLRWETTSVFYTVLFHPDFSKTWCIGTVSKTQTCWSLLLYNIIYICYILLLLQYYKMCIKYVTNLGQHKLLYASFKMQTILFWCLLVVVIRPRGFDEN